MAVNYNNIVKIRIRDKQDIGTTNTAELIQYEDHAMKGKPWRKNTMGKGLLDIRQDGSERVKYHFEHYSAYIVKAFLSHHPNYTADSHWHEDLEFIYVLSGFMKYNVNGEIVHIGAGNGIFVNSCQLHFGFSDTMEESEFICVLLHPALLEATAGITQEYISPVLKNSALPYILLQKEEPWQYAILEEVRMIYQAKAVEHAPLYIQKAFWDIWIHIYENVSRKKQTMSKEDGRLAALKNMLAYIQENYNEKISLEEIALSGNVSKSTCLTLFKKYLQDTPTHYMVSYRLKRATELLRETELSVSEIALAVGFGGSSYFAECFHKSFHCTPREYRNEYSYLPILK